MVFFPQNQVRYFCSVVLVVLVSQIAVCEDYSSVINSTQKSSSSSVSTNSPTSTNVTKNDGTKHDEIESITNQKLSSDGPPADLPDKTSKASLSQNIPSNIELLNHSTVATVSAPQLIINTAAPPIANLTSSPASTTESHPPSIPTVSAPVHRKSKPEETSVDEVIGDSGPTTDYVVPLVVAMLAVPLVGVLCAILYMKGRDFWERRHYGRIDFLWDSRNESRMDFLIDGMYNN